MPEEVQRELHVPGRERDPVVPPHIGPEVNRPLAIVVRTLPAAREAPFQRSIGAPRGEWREDQELGRHVVREPSTFSSPRERIVRVNGRPSSRDGGAACRPPGGRPASGHLAVASMDPRPRRASERDRVRGPRRDTPSITPTGSDTRPGVRSPCPPAGEASPDRPAAPPDTATRRGSRTAPRPEKVARRGARSAA